MRLPKIKTYPLCICGHRSNKHVMGEGPCVVDGCFCTMFDDIDAPDEELDKPIPTHTHGYTGEEFEEDGGYDVDEEYYE